MLSTDTSYLAPVAGNGCTMMRRPPSVDEYATQRPSRENTALVGSPDCTAPNGAALRSASDSVHSEVFGPVVALNRRWAPSGDHDSGA